MFQEKDQEYLRQYLEGNWPRARQGSGNVAKLIDIDVAEFREDSAVPWPSHFSALHKDAVERVTRVTNNRDSYLSRRINGRDRSNSSIN